MFNDRGKAFFFSRVSHIFSQAENKKEKQAESAGKKRYILVLTLVDTCDGFKENRMRDMWQPLENEATRGNQVTWVHGRAPGHHPLCTLQTAAKQELGLLSWKGVL